MGARRSNSIYEGWLPAAGPSWYPAAPGPSLGVDYVSGAADWPGVDWSHHMQMTSGLFTIGAGGTFTVTLVLTAGLGTARVGADVYMLCGSIVLCS